MLIRATDCGAEYKKKPHIHGQLVGLSKDGRFNVEKVTVHLQKAAIGLTDIETEEKELVNLGPYFPFVSTVTFFVSLDDYEAFTKKYPQTQGSYPQFTIDHNDLQNKNKASGTDEPFPFDVYVTTKPHPETEERFVHPIMMIRSNPSGDRVGRVMHYEINDLYCIHKSKFLREHNMPIIRRMQMGWDTPLECKISKENVEQIEITWDNGDYSFGNGFDLHHMLVKNNSSVRKLSEDPAKLIVSYKLDDLNYKDQLIDALGTVSLSKTVHAIVHANTPTQGIERYKKDWLPWALQNNRNFDDFCGEYNLDLNYDYFMYWHSTVSLDEK